jgi:2-polyprenyl-6-hydroxyphenyl methylase/3-demethylubiquinone-9 3-methyltransferase
MNKHTLKTYTEPRFEFGKNWSRFLTVLDDTRIMRAEKSLQRKLEVSTLCHQKFLDIGSGSGLFSLAARRLGARVHSFDYDPEAVACTAELKRRYFPCDDNWTIEEGSVLDEQYIRSLGTFDVVYAWGVLHHTGAMWKALEDAHLPVTAGGKLFISIYNDQGRVSQYWRTIKRLYNQVPSGLRFLIVWPLFARVWGPTVLLDSLRGHPLRTWHNRINARGMSPWRDVIDWAGGYPFEVAKPEEVFLFYRHRGLTLLALKTCGGGLGCNEFVFEKKETGLEGRVMFEDESSWREGVFEREPGARG